MVQEDKPGREGREGGCHLWRDTPLYTEEADAPWRRFCAALLPALVEARAARFGGGESLHKPAAQTSGCEELDSPA